MNRVVERNLLVNISLLSVFEIGFGEDETKSTQLDIEV